MGPVTGIVLYAIIWFMVLFIILPIRMQTQDEAGQRTPGTPGSAPANPQLKRRFILTSAIATVIWAGIATIIITGAITIEDIDIFNRLNAHV
jgi:predicted secreted protein